MRLTLRLLVTVLIFSGLSVDLSAQTDITVRMWRDSNGDGLENGGEPGVVLPSGPILPELYSDADGNGFIDDAVADLVVTASIVGGGEYVFSGVADGDYIVLFPELGAPEVPTRPSTVLPLDADADSDIEPGNTFNGIEFVGFATEAFTVASQGAILEVDAGYVVPVNIGDMAFEDTDGDGTQNGMTEPGIEDVNVTLWYQPPGGLPEVQVTDDASGAALTNPVLTDGAGIYSFDNIFPGDYRLEFQATTLHPTNGQNYFVTDPDVGGDDDDDSDIARISPLIGEVFVSLVSGSPDEETRVDAGFYAPVSIGDFVWNDDNGNGEQDEAIVPPPSDYTIELQEFGTGAPVNDANNNPILGQTGGPYLFQLVPPGSYEVVFTAAAPDADNTLYRLSPHDVTGGTDDINDTDDDSDANTTVSGDVTTGATHEIIVLSGETDEEMRIDAGAIACVRVGGDFWADANGNGIQDAGEVPVDGVELMLFDDDAGATAIECDGVTPAATVLTGSGPNGAGSYEFQNVGPGTYRVEIVSLPAGPPNYVLTQLDATGSLGTPDDVDSDFDATDNDRTDVFTIVSGTIDEQERIDGGLVSPIIIGDMVWHDINGDGVQDPGEPGLPNIEVTITRQDGAPVTDITGAPYPATTVLTDGAGMYQFDDLPQADYTITFFSGATEPDFYLTLEDYSGAVDAADIDDDSDAIRDPGFQSGSVDVSPVVDAANPDGTETIRIDAGFFNPVSIGDQVWHDQILNGLQDEVPLEGVPGIEVTLLDNTGAPVGQNATGGGFINGNPTFTDGGGNYEFDLVPPGTGYQVQFSDGTDWYLTPLSDLSGAGPAGTDDSDALFVAGTWQSGTTEPFDVVSENTTNYEDNTMRIDAGFYDPSTVGDMVWHDLNGNGEQDDAPLGGPTDEFVVTIEAIGPSALGSPTPTEDAEGTALPLNETTAGGMYSFDLLKPGEYRVTFVKPAAAMPEYTFSPQDVTGGTDEASDTGDDSDADITTGETHAINIESREDVDLPGLDEERIDAGVFRCVNIGGDAWVDANGDGLQDPGEGPLDGVVFALFDFNGNPVTDCDGNAVANQVSGSGPNGAGSYQFEKIPPGDYYVELVSLPAANQNLTLDEQQGPGPQGDLDSDFPMGAAPQVTAVFTVDSESTDEEERIDAGVIQPAAIEILVWHDSNGDGQQEIGAGDECGEDPLDNDEAAFELLLNGAPANDAMGNPVVWMNMGGGVYRAENLAPGTNYTIAATPNGPWQITTVHFDGTTADIGDSDIDSDFDPGSGQCPPFEIQAGNNKVNIDLGMWQFVNLGGFAFFSNDCSACEFGGPPDQDVAAEVVINLWVEDPLGSGNFTTLLGQVQTDMMGVYSFTMLPPGNYRIEMDKTTFEAGGQFEVFMPSPLCDDPNNDKDGENDGEGVFNDEGGIDINFARMRSGCEPQDGGQTNNTFDFGICFEFDCSQTNQDYLEQECTNTDPSNPDYNPFFPICDVFILNQFCATMISGNSPGSQPSPLCANGGVPHNISWFSFVAGEGDYQLEVVPGNCNNAGGNIGIQNGIYTDCGFGMEVQCQGVCTTAPITLDSQDPPGSGNYQLEPGQIYYWFLDGCNGSVCDFEISVLGNFTPFFPDPPTDLFCSGSAGLDAACDGFICPGESVTFTLEPWTIDEGVRFDWSITPNDGQWTATNQDPATVVDPITFEQFLNVEFNPDLMPGEEITYTICWDRIFSKCFEIDGPICQDVTVKQLADEDFGTVELCESDLFAYVGPEADENGNTDPNGDGLEGWLCNDIFNAGINECEYVNASGCTFTQTVEIIELFNPEPERFDTVVCDEWELQIGFDFIEFPAENYSERDLLLSPDILASNGCDTFIDLYAWYMNMDAMLIGECITGPDGNPAFSLVLDTISTSEESSSITRVITVDWYEVAFGVGEGFEQQDGDPDNNPYTFITNTAGDWTVIVTMTVLDIDTGDPLPGCEFVYDINVDPSVFLPQNPVPGPWNTMPCAEGNPPVLYTITSGADETPTWIWPGDVMSATGQGTDSLTIDWNGSAGGDIGVFVTNECGVSDTLFETVTLISVPDPVIAIDLDTTCVDSLFEITSVGPTIGGEVYSWNFNGGVVQGGPATGPGPHLVSWPNVGDFVVSLQTSVGSCVSNVSTDTVTTVGPIAAPVITCGVSTNTSASFTWAPVPGAIEYIVEVVQGPATATGGTQTGTTFTVNGMALGDGAIIQVTAVTDNPCGNTIGVSVECFAQDCPQESITLTSTADTLCFDAGLGLSAIDIAWLDGTIPPGAGVFDGPGIDNPATAAFNPITAGIGTHTITYTYTGAGVDPSNGEDYTGCVYSAPMTFVVFETPTSDFTVTGDNICITDQSTLTYTGNTTNGTYTWTFAPDGGPVDGIGPHDITWPTAGAKTVELIVDRNGCVSPPTTLPVNVDDLVGQVDVECGTGTATSIEFVWSTVANASEYALVEDGTPIPNQTATSLERTGLVPGSEITLIVEAISDNLCPSTSDTITCLAANCPDITLTLPTDTVVCSDVAAFDLSWDIAGGLQDGSGVGVWRGTGITDSVAGTFDPAVSGIGDFTITLDYVEGPGGFCSESATMEVSVIDVPVVSFDISDDTICLNETIIINYTGTPNSLRPQVSVTGGDLEASGNGRDFRWTFTSEGTYTVTAEAFAGSCIGTPVSATVVVLPTPDETVVVRCDSSNLDYIRFGWEALTCAITFEVFIDGVSMGVQSDLTYEITGLNEGDERTIRVVPINECDCATVNEGTETCEATACPDISASITPDQTEICTDDIVPGLTIDITADVMSDGTGTGQSQWSGQNVDQSGVFSPEGLAPGTYDIMYSYAEQGGACGAQAMTSITINSTPQGLISPVDPLCIEDNFGTAELGSAIEGEVYEYSVNGGAITTDASLTDLAPGNYNVEFINPATGCSSTENFEIVSAPTVMAEIQGDGTIILVGEVATLRVEVQPIDLSDVNDITWTNETTGEVIPCEVAPCPQIQVMPETTSNYCATITYNDGCIVDACAEVRVFEDKDLTFPNIFNPTGDANTSFFVPTNGEWTEIRSMQIFNRWGELVFSDSNIPADQAIERGWDGTFKGKPVNPGVFVWTVEILTVDDNGQPELIIEKGDVTVIR